MLVSNTRVHEVCYWTLSNGRNDRLPSLNEWEPVILRMSQFTFTLYVAGRTMRSQQAIVNLRRIATLLGGTASLSVVDVIEDPEAAERARILTTPTLVKVAPAPERRITGDLYDADRVLVGLGLEPNPTLPYAGDPAS
jgi:circadian clock protein KaiB